MQINHDADAMGKMLDGDYVFADYDGSVLTKSQFLVTIRDKSIPVTVEVSENMKLFRHGDTRHWLDSGKGHWERQTVFAPGPVTDTWIKKDGQ